MAEQSAEDREVAGLDALEQREQLGERVVVVGPAVVDQVQGDLAHAVVDLLVVPTICLAFFLGTQFGLAVVGDFGSGTANETAVASLIESWHPDFVLTVGDNAYPQGSARLLAGGGNSPSAIHCAPLSR